MVERRESAYSLNILQNDEIDELDDLSQYGKVMALKDYREEEKREHEIKEL